MKLLIPAIALASLVLSQTARAQEAEATAVPAVKAPSTPATNPAMKAGPITVTVDIMGGQRITGALTELGAIPVRASWGPGEIPVPEIAGVKFASAEDPSTTIIMKNGDSVTVATDLKSVVVETEWGQAKINGSAIMSMLFIPDLKWTASMGLNGKRWSLADAKANPQQVPGSPTTTPPSATGAQPINNSVSRPSIPSVGR
jgi:hypothetical protein